MWYWKVLAEMDARFSYIGQCLFQLVVVECKLLNGLLAEAPIDDIFVVF